MRLSHDETEWTLPRQDLSWNAAENRMYCDYRGNENNSNKSAGDVLESVITWNDWWSLQQ